VARWLIARFPLHYYHYDRHEREHIARRDPVRHPELDAYEALSIDDRWVACPVGEMVRATVTAWRERFAMVLDDLRALPADRAILAEGPGLLPESVAPFLLSPRRAIWLVPTEGFKRATQPTRGGAPADQTSDPPRACENLIALDLQLARDVQAHAAALGLTVIVVDGALSIEDLGRMSAAHFGLSPEGAGAV
jgi:hypothetical protein